MRGHNCQHPSKIKRSLFQKPALLQQRGFKFKGHEVSAQHSG